jgi:DNA-binding HxlR family transcriptional regulator
VSFTDIKACPLRYVLAINDTLNVLTGKWKLPIIGSLLSDRKRFTEIQQTIPRITPRMLSKELKELEINGMIKRTVRNTSPVTVEYELTESAVQFREVLDKMLQWGLQHRDSVFSQENQDQA